MDDYTVLQIPTEDALSLEYIPHFPLIADDKHVALALCCAADILPHRGIISHRRFEWKLRSYEHRFPFVRDQYDVVFSTFCKLFFPFALEMRGSGQRALSSPYYFEDAVIIGSVYHHRCIFCRSLADYAFMTGVLHADN